MTELVKQQLDYLKTREYRKLRKEGNVQIPTSYPFYKETLNYELCGIILKTTLENEDILLYPNDRFGFHRSQLDAAQYQLENGPWKEYGACNLTPNYFKVISRGFDSLEEEIKTYMQHADAAQTRFYRSLLIHLDAISEHCERVRKEAQRQGCAELAEALLTVPRKPATSLYQACLFQAILIYSMRMVNNNHLTLGRFDQYMYSYYLADLKAGKSKEELLETLELFFIQLNFDTDLYVGIQQGDNGQSMVLGGFDANGESMFHDFSRMCMEASMELNLIDPKINLRVGKNTPMELFELGTKMTKLGLGFPQYCNDDVVVPGLTALGYDREDALDYTVAACWEYIVPNCAADIPNLETFNFPLVVNRAVHASLSHSASFESLMQAVKEEIATECLRIRKIVAYHKELLSPMMSMMIDGCMEAGKDFSELVAKYNNYGCHGAGIANAADALATIKKLIYDEKTLDKQMLLQALDANFEGYTELRNRLLSCPKMGNNDAYVDKIAYELMDSFSKHLHGRPNTVGGVWRAGTGSAMEYILSAKECPATADGRLKGAPYGCSFSPAITTRLDGPLSVIQSFTNYDLNKIINGGPLTMEIHDTVFRNEIGEKKVAQLVRLFIEQGGHQLQLNSINRDTLLNAQKHPEDYPNLIVRVWGWSGYFCELDKEYQDHIIKRTEFQFA